jgi:16S rRNA (adenine(1408)-N(1))-methyltransferase
VKLVKGRKTFELNSEDLKNVCKNFSKVVVDLGTGDGRFIYDNAVKNVSTLYVGIDPSQKQLEVYSKKSQKRKLNNTLFVLGSVEYLPCELTGIADEIYILLPWGTLLKAIVEQSDWAVSGINALFKPKGKLEIILGYSLENEPTETQRLNIPDLNEEVIHNIISKYVLYGYKLLGFSVIDKYNLRKLKTTWGNKLAFGTNRPVFKIQLLKII